MEESLLDLDEMLAAWLITLRAERKDPDTLKAYRTGVQQFINFCGAQGIPVELTKPNVIGYMESISKWSANTAILRLRAIKLFVRWLAEEEGVDGLDGVLAVRAPKLDEPIVKHLTDREVEAMLKACDGTTLIDKRDKALVRLFAETGVRADEMLSIQVNDISIADCSASVHGKGRKGRRVTFGPQTAAVLDKYIRVRRKTGVTHDYLWISARGSRPLSYSGLRDRLRDRAEDAGVPGFHLHRLRHTMAVHWMAGGGSEPGLMAQGGWRSRKMVDRYVRSGNEQLAAAEFERLNLAFD